MKPNRFVNAWILIGGLTVMFLVCDKPDPDLVAVYPTPRVVPTVYWQFIPYDSICGRPIISTTALYTEAFYDGTGRELRIEPRIRYFLAAVEPNDTTIQIWRVEWAPVASGDSCFVPIAYPTLHKGWPAGIMTFVIEGAAVATDSTLGDHILIWRSHPWPETLPVLPEGFIMWPTREYCGAQP